MTALNFSALALPTLRSLGEQPRPQLLPTGLIEIDALTGGLPRGGLTELVGPESSGRTSSMLSVLARATAQDEVCALADAQDSFDPLSAEAAGVRIEQLLWVRCGGLEQALKATDWMVHAGGFGVLVLDIGRMPPDITRRVPLSTWYRLRRVIQGTPTVLLAIAQEPSSCASLVLRFEVSGMDWSGTEKQLSSNCLLRNLGARVEVCQARRFSAGGSAKSAQIQFRPHLAGYAYSGG